MTYETKTNSFLHNRRGVHMRFLMLKTVTNKYHSWEECCVGKGIHVGSEPLTQFSIMFSIVTIWLDLQLTFFGHTSFIVMVVFDWVSCFPYIFLHVFHSSSMLNDVMCFHDKEELNAYVKKGYAFIICELIISIILCCSQ